MVSPVMSRIHLKRLSMFHNLVGRLVVFIHDPNSDLCAGESPKNMGFVGCCGYMRDFGAPRLN